jgi:DNA-binding CsgD family transcriptional regulator
LNEKERLLIDLYLKNLSTKEIAAQINTTENIVRVQRSRLFRKLREAGVDPQELN